MTETPIPRPSAADWSAALLTSSSEALLGAVRNYIGPVKTPFDKRDLVQRLEAFLKRAENRQAAMELLDGLDRRILASVMLVGPLPDQSLKELFLGEIPLFELGVRISNLLDRLLLFRYQLGGRRFLAVNPLLEEELKTAVSDMEALFGGMGSLPQTEEESLPVTVEVSVAFFSFLFHAPLSMRKTGILSKRASERAAALFPGLAAGKPDRPGYLAEALSAAGAIPLGGEEGREPDREALSALLTEWGGDFVYYLAACLALSSASGKNASSACAEDDSSQADFRIEARDLATALAAGLRSLPPDRLFGKQALIRWLRIAAKRSQLGSIPDETLSALENLGLLAEKTGGYQLRLPQAKAENPRQGGPLLVVEGTHALHLMPEASLEDRLFVGCAARPSAVGTVWTFEMDRETIRRAFTVGISASQIEGRFSELAGSPLPQSFTFTLKAWEEEYRSLRLYRGFVLVADERQRPLVERASSLGHLQAERLAPGVYFLQAASNEALSAALSACGLEPPPTILGSGSGGGARLAASDRAGKAAELSAARQRIGSLAAQLSLPRAELDPGAAKTLPEGSLENRLEALRKILAASTRGEEARRELADRIDRRLVLTERQILESDPHGERLEAGGLDYMGKVRVVERALRSAGDRLEVVYRLPGADPVRALLRPVKLDKNEKGLILEAEDLGTGAPLRVSLGAISTVRRLRASLFGDEQ